MANRASEPEVILVTGASSGIGEATALSLIRQGYVVYGAARRIAKMGDIEAAGGRTLSLDITDHDAVAAAVARVVDEAGRIDVLVNNAGFGTFGSVEDTTIEDARRQFEVNLFGTAAVTKAVLAVMREQGSGRIINVSSVAGKIHTPLGAWYHASKHALEGWSDCLRLEVRQFGIDVVIVEPGAVVTEFGDTMIQPMLDRSRSGPYEDLANALANAPITSHEKGGGSPPSVIAKAISRAIRARKPKVRYRAGKYAKPVLALERWCPDRIFDRIIIGQVERLR